MAIMKSLGEQINILGSYFPELRGISLEIIKTNQPVQAEGLACIPVWSMLGATYEEATNRVASIIDRILFSDFFNILETFSTTQKIISPSTDLMRMYKHYQKKQKNKRVIIVPSSYCMETNMERDKKRELSQNEIFLGPYEVGIHLIAHEDRLDDPETWIGCNGARLIVDGNKSNILYFVHRVETGEFELDYEEENDWQFGLDFASAYIV